MEKKRQAKPDREPEKKPRKENGKIEIFTRFIVRNGKTIYPKNGKYFHFWVTPKSASDHKGQ